MLLLKMVNQNRWGILYSTKFVREITLDFDLRYDINQAADHRSKDTIILGLFWTVIKGLSRNQKWSTDPELT